MLPSSNATSKPSSPPNYSPGDIVFIDNVGFHKSVRAAELVRQRSARQLDEFTRECLTIRIGES
jgi:hypothetical protein